MTAMWWMCLYIGTLSTILGNLVATIICFHSGIPEGQPISWKSVFSIFRRRPKIASCGCRIRKGIIVEPCDTAILMQYKARKVKCYVFPFSMVYLMRLRKLNCHYGNALEEIRG